jgi:hypothetical protein
MKTSRLMDTTHDENNKWACLRVAGNTELPVTAELPWGSAPLYNDISLSVLGYGRVAGKRTTLS